MSIKDYSSDPLRTRRCYSQDDDISQDSWRKINKERKKNCSRGQQAGEFVERAERVECSMEPGQTPFIEVQLMIDLSCKNPARLVGFNIKKFNDGNCNYLKACSGILSQSIKAFSFYLAVHRLLCQLETKVRLSSAFLSPSSKIPAPVWIGCLTCFFGVIWFQFGSKTDAADWWIRCILTGAMNAHQCSGWRLKSMTTVQRVWLDPSHCCQERKYGGGWYLNIVLCEFHEALLHFFFKGRYERNPPMSLQSLY